MPIFDAAGVRVCVCNIYVYIVSTFRGRKLYELYAICDESAHNVSVHIHHICSYVICYIYIYHVSYDIYANHMSYVMYAYHMPCVIYAYQVSYVIYTYTYVHM